MSEQLTYSSVKTNKPGRRLLSALYFITLARCDENLSEPFIGGPCWMLRDGSPSEQKSPWSTAIYWSGQRVQSIEKKRRGETTLRGENSLFKEAEGGLHTHPDRTGSMYSYMEAACAQGSRWKEMHFSTEANRRGLYYVLGSAMNVMRKLAEGGRKKKKKISGGAAWDEIWDEAM